MGLSLYALGRTGLAVVPVVSDKENNRDLIKGFRPTLHVCGVPGVRKGFGSILFISCTDY